jgi:ATP-dependent helicase/nuclease subunit B
MGGLRLVRGGPVELERALVKRIGASREKDPLAPVAVLIGGTLLRPYLQRRLATAYGGIANVHFLMPSELALALGEGNLVAQGRTPLPPLADRILLRQLAADHLGYFEPVRDAPGFASALFQLVRELRGAGYDAETFAGAIDGTCEAEGKEGALSELYAEFLRRRAGFYGPDDCLLQADTAVAPWAELSVYGLWQMPAMLRRAVVDLATRMDVAVLLPRTGTHADGSTDELAAALLADGAVESSTADEAEAESGIEHARARLFNPGTAGPLDGSVRLTSALEPAREVREVARTCLAWAADGIPFHEMAIAYRHPDEYRPAIEAVFGEAKIPLYLHEGTPLIERPVGRQAAALLDLVEGNLERRAVMDFLTDVRLPKSTWEAYGNAPTARWDQLSREAGIVEGRDQWRERLAARREDMLRGRTLEELTEWRRRDVERLDHLARFITDLGRALADHPAVAPWSEHLESLARLLRRYISRPEPILDALDGLKRFDALGGAVAHDRFLGIVWEALDTLRSDEVLGTPKGAFARRGVNVLDVNSLRHLRFRAVAILGLAERSFPSPPRQDPLLLDHERVALNEAGPAPVPLRARGADPEPLQFAMGVAAARERLMVTYPRKSAGEGRPQLPSVFFRAVAEAMTGERVSAENVDTLDARLYRRVPGGSIGSRGETPELSGSEYDRTLLEQHPDVGRALLTSREPRIARALDARAAAFSRELTVFDAVLTDSGRERMQSKWDPARPLSPSSLETYARCPHRYFLESVLRLKPVEEPEAVIRISALDRGSLIHTILERFLAEPPEEGLLLHGPGEAARLRSIVDHECDRAEERGQSGYTLMWRYDRAQLRDDLERWLELERLDPSFAAMPKGAFELSFGAWEDADEDPIDIEADGVLLRVQGRIDRLNWDEGLTRYRVIDYKTGKAHEPKDGALKGGDALQLPLYLIAGARHTGIPVEQGRAEYHFATRRGEFKTQAFSGDHLRDRRDELDRILSTIARGIRDGVFNMAPPEERTCEWCPFDALCPSDRHRRIERKSGDPRAAELLSLREIE